MRLTTKTGVQFETELVTKAVWDKMRAQLGITTYKKGKRSATYGAGTLLHKFTNRKLWRKIRG